MGRAERQSIRCAIYTRESTEEGLGPIFNSHKDSKGAVTYKTQRGS